MKIALNRSSIGFWGLYFAVHFSFLLIILGVVRMIWSKLNHGIFVFDLAEMAFESLIYAITITVVKFIRYYISKKRYEKNPVDRRKNNLFRE